MRSLSIFGSLLVFLALCLPAFGITLVKDGASPYRIVLPADAIPSEKYAAEELQRYLAQMSGATLPIVTDAEKVVKQEILLGNNAHLAKLKVKLPAADLGKEGFTLLTKGETLVIAGGRPRGVLYGVYGLLEDKLGVRWYTPDAEVVPEKKTITLPALKETQKPAFDYREVYWTPTIQNADFAARLRLNGQNYPLADKHGGRGAVYAPGFCHTLDALVPQSLYAEHPEYFPLIDGKRVNGYVQRCLSNPDVLKITIAAVRKTLQEHPEATIISVTQNDAYSYCKCDQCRALDEAEGTPAASVLRFVNAIAEDIEKDYPNVLIDTFAYQYTRTAPKTLRPRRNVTIRLCSIECCFAHPLDSCPSERNIRFSNDIKAWEKIAPRLDIWDYTTNFTNYVQPHPNFDVLQANVRFFAKHGVKGLFEQGAYQPLANAEMTPLRSYLLAKLVWNPDADVKALTDDFLRGYYGEAAGAIRQYLDIIETPVRDGKIHLGCFERPTAPYLTDDVITRADAVLADAEKNARSDTIRLRVQTARLPIWYVQIMTNRVTGQARADLLVRFVDIARQSKTGMIAEGLTLDKWLEGIKK